MKGIPATYLGRLVSKENFRVFIYASSGEQKLVNSWEEYEKFMETGLWFATREDAAASLSIPIEEEKPKPKRAKKEVVESVKPMNAKVFEISDDFLSREN